MGGGCVVWTSPSISTRWVSNHPYMLLWGFQIAPISCYEGGSKSSLINCYQRGFRLPPYVAMRGVSNFLRKLLWGAFQIGPVSCYDGVFKSSLYIATRGVSNRPCTFIWGVFKTPLLVSTRVVYLEPPLIITFSMRSVYLQLHLIISFLERIHNLP